MSGKIKHMKKCSKCGEQKPLALFVKRKQSKSGHGSTCKACAALYMSEYYKKNPDKAATNRSKQTLRDAGKNRFTRHKITIGEYDEMVAKFDGACWSCRVRPATVIDHDHKCCSTQYSCGGCVRGVLCGQCNTALGLLRDDTTLIDRLSEYIKMPHR